jgi:light-regulated signal transduction histidine kinase (bacteriophytochrome)
MFKRLHTKDEYQGTGIGLSMCKKIIETMSGKIWLESEPGEGSTFYVLFPIESIQLTQQNPAQS